MAEASVEIQGSHFGALKTCQTLLKIQCVAAEHTLTGDVTDDNRERVASATSKLIKEIEVYLQAPNVLYPHVESLAKDPWHTLQFALELPHLDLAHLLDTRVIEHVCHYLYNLAKVVGISKCLEAAPTSVQFFIPALELLERIYTELNPADIYARGLENFWCVELILLAWQSLLVKVPFGFHLFLDDGNETSGAGHLQQAEATRQVATRVICLANGYLDKATRARDMAAMLTCNVLARPDVIACGLTREYLLNMTASVPSIGILHVLKQLVKRAPSTLVDDICDIHILLQNESYNSTCEKTLQASCLGYFGLIVLDYSSTIDATDVLRGVYPRKASREATDHNALQGASHKDHQNVGMDLESQKPIAATTTSATGEIDTATHVLPRISAKEIIEVILGKLLLLVLEPANPIRWASCKSLGRLSSRLPSEWCMQILNHLAANVRQDNATECIMHGACMGIAQVVQFGRLEANMYHKVVIDAVCLGLGYNLWRGNASAGASVRDACCYICWAVARGVSNLQDAKDDISSLSRELVNVALFDSSINCRRAACAAIQEMVGRWATVPYGLGLLKVLDYYSVGNFQRAFINLSAKVANLGQGWYTSSMLTFVYKHKLHHPNFNLRRMAAIAMAKLSPPATNIYLDLYVANATIGTPSVMHGSLLALTSTLRFYQNNVHLHKHMADIKRIPCTFEKRRLFRGKGGGMQREAICRLVGAIALQRDTNIDAYIGVYTTIIKDSLRNFTTSVQVAAADALGALVSRAVVGADVDGCGVMQGAAWLDSVRGFLMASVANVGDNVAARRGYALALSRFASATGFDVVKNEASEAATLGMDVKNDCIGIVNEGQLLDVLAKLVIDGKNNSHKDSDANVRQYALLSMSFVLEGMQDNIRPLHLEAASRAVEAGAGDLECDARGDVGSWVRSVACEVGTLMLQKYLSGEGDILQLEWASRVFGSIAHVALDPLDNVRARATYLLVMSLARRKVYPCMSAQGIWQRILYGCHYRMKLDVELLECGDDGGSETLELLALRLYQKVQENCYRNRQELKLDEELNGIREDNLSRKQQELPEKEKENENDEEEEDDDEDKDVDVDVDVNVDVNVNVNSDLCVLDHVIVDKASFPLPGWANLATSFPLLFKLLRLPQVSKFVASGIIRLLGSRHRQVDALLFNELTQLDQNTRDGVAKLLGDVLEFQYKLALANNDQRACLVCIVAARSLVQLGLISQVNATLELALEQCASCKNYAHVKALVKLVYEALEFRPHVLAVALGFLRHEYPTIRSHALECLELYLTSKYGRIDDAEVAVDDEGDDGDEDSDDEESEDRKLGEAMQMVQGVALDNLTSVEAFIQDVFKFVSR